VSQHKRREAAWRESEEKLRLALDATGIGLWSWDAVTHEVEWDARMRELCGVAEPLDLRRYTRELVHPEDRALVEEGGRATLSTGEYVGVPHRLLRSDGSVRWIVTSASMLRDDQGKPIRLVGGNLDITEQRMLEEQLRQAQKMEALGNLTAGIAHNLNNVLMVLLPSLELLERAVPPEHAQTARDARQSAQRGAEYIRELMTFAGQRGAMARRAHDVGEIVVRTLRMCRRTVDQEIDLDARIASGTPLILCDAAGVEQVLWNVLLNARDALAALEPRGVAGEGPRIHVTVDSVSAVTLPAQVSRRASRYVRIRVEDNGPGMSDEVRRKIFEPFFTTKSVTQASGLGLATSYAIIRDHDGWIACESRQGVGTVISVHLPVTTEEPTVVTEPASAASTPGATILLVDDEEAIRHVVSQLLEEEGHRVIAVPGGADALAAARKHREVALVMLDRSMAGMAGHKLVHSLREQLPAARIVYFTGQDVPAKERALVDGIIRKPLSGLALSLAVREALTAMPGRSPD
jgi:PAS domain S-box-containing protein